MHWVWTILIQDVVGQVNQAHPSVADQLGVLYVQQRSLVNILGGSAATLVLMQMKDHMSGEKRAICGVHGSLANTAHTLRTLCANIAQISQAACGSQSVALEANPSISAHDPPFF